MAQNYQSIYLEVDTDKLTDEVKYTQRDISSRMDYIKKNTGPARSLPLDDETDESEKDKWEVAVLSTDEATHQRILPILSSAQKILNASVKAMEKMIGPIRQLPIDASIEPQRKTNLEG